MANICVEIARPIEDGTILTLRAPCNCDVVEGVKVTYPTVTDDAITQTSKNFTFRDVHGKNLTGIGNLFSEGALIQVMLDVTNEGALILNADTNEYLENKFSTVTTLNNMLSTGAMVLVNGIHYGDELPAAGTKGRIFFKKVVE